MNNIKMGNIESEHNDYTCNGKCSNCDACCSNTLPMTKQDIARVRRYINKHHIEPINHVPAIVAYKHMDGICPFRDMTNERCVIYEARPTVCRLYQCNYSIVDIAKAVKGKFSSSKAKSYDVRSTFYGNGELGVASLLTIAEGNKHFNKEFEENKDAFLGVIKGE